MAFSYHPGFIKQVVLDERSAAFIALGIGKESGSPAILVCTSGTAAVNYHPAIAEAKESGVPMIVCTADRPPSLRGVGSSQTLDQVKLFGSSSVWFHELGEPADTEQDHRRIRYAAKQAVEESILAGGASHINIPFRKPLEPTKDQISSHKVLFDKQFEQPAPDRSVSNSSTITLARAVEDLLNQSRRPLIIADPADPFRQQQQTALNLADHLNAPIIAEPGSGIPPHPLKIERFDQILRNGESPENLSPDIILRFGDQPYSKSLLQALHQFREVPLIRFDSRNAWQDHEMNTRYRIPFRSADQLNMAGINPKKDNRYIENWLDAGQTAESALKRSLAGATPLCDGHIFHYLANNLPEEWNVMLSNSLPVRDAALFGAPQGTLFLNRGAAGIDGIISTAIGTARSSGVPTCCVIGDLAFLHDSNALLSLKQLETPFVVLVINNNGGNIFRMLPVHEHKDVYRDYFETPQEADIRHLCLAHSLNYRRIETLNELSNLHFGSADDFSKPAVIEFRTNPDASMNLRKGLWGR